MGALTVHIYIGNDNVLTMDGLKDVVTDAFLNAATVTAQLKTAEGADVGGALTLSYVAESRGRYRATIEDDLALIDQTAYQVHIDVDAGADLRAHWEVPVTAITRR